MCEVYPSGNLYISPTDADAVDLAGASALVVCRYRLHPDLVVDLHHMVGEERGHAARYR